MTICPDTNDGVKLSLSTSLRHEITRNRTLASRNSSSRTVGEEYETLHRDPIIKLLKFYNVKGVALRGLVQMRSSPAFVILSLSGFSAFATLSILMELQ